MRLGLVELDQFAEIHESRVIGTARRLLHVVGDDGDAIIGFQFGDQLFDALGRDRVERRGGLVEQQYLGLYRDRAGDAQPLLLAARQAEAALLQLVLDLVPQRRALQRPFDPVVEFGLRQPFVEPDAEGDVVVDRHRKRRRLLEHHADPGAQPI